MKQQFIDALVKRMPLLDDFVSIMARNDIEVVTAKDRALPLIYDRSRITIEIDDNGRVIRSSQIQPRPSMKNR